MIEILKDLVKLLIWRNWVLTKIHFSLFGKKELLISSDTEIVIDGFPRCANTYAVTKFMDSNPSRKNVLAHHIHYPSQIIKGVALGLPVVLLVRCPADVIISLCIREKRSIESAVRLYIGFYEKLLPLKDSVVVADFETVTNDFANLMHRVNEKYGSDFVHVSCSTEEGILSKVEYWNEVDSGGDLMKSSAPNPLKAELRKSYQEELASPKVSPLLNKATEIYESLVKA